jgi:hypothetical protein
LKKLTILSLLLLVGILNAQTSIRRVDLTWSAPDNAVIAQTASYNIYRTIGNCATVAATSFAKVGSSTTLAFSDTTVNQTPPAAGISYCYAITAVGPGGESDMSTFTQAVLLQLPPKPNPPTNVIAKPF